MKSPDIFVTTVFDIGPLAFSDSLITTWALMTVIWLCSWIATRKLREEPGLLQTATESMVLAMETAVREVSPADYRLISPFIMTLWLFILTANLVGLLPGVSSPTRDLSVTVPLAVLVFASVHWFGIRSQGLRLYLRHYLLPSPILLPFHIIGEVTRTLALAVRLFGNMMSLEMVALLLLVIAGFLVPVPILMLHIIEALVQAYIFGMLALIYIASGLQSQRLSARSGDEEDSGEGT